jgi:hypothetical protein
MVTTADIHTNLPAWPVDLIQPWLIEFANDPGLGWPPRSPDRTRSPVAVSRKREYFKYPPETIGDFAPIAANFGARRPTANLQ